MKLKYGYTIIVIVGTSSNLDGLSKAHLDVGLTHINYCGAKDQWRILEEMRNVCGGIVYVTANCDSAFRELIDDFIGEDGFIKETGRKIVHTKEHGDFCVNLVWNKEREDWI